MGLRWPLSRDSQFKFYFYLGDEKIEDCAKVSTSPLFEGSLINNNELRDKFNKNKMHGNTNMTWNKMTNLRAKGYVWHKIISTFTLMKVKFKATPIERQSL